MHCGLHGLTRYSADGTERREIADGKLAASEIVHGNAETISSCLDFNFPFAGRQTHVLVRILEGDQEGTMIGLVSMIGSCGSPEKAAIEALVVGTIATLATDLWLWLLQIVGVPPANWALVGRWVAWMPRGVFVHRPIAATPSIRGELAIGWGFHYAVGIAYAALYLAISRLVLGSGPTLISALVFAIALLVVPWFVMQPALGLGFFAARTPHPSVTRIISISGHAAFGVGLHLGSISTSFL